MPTLTVEYATDADRLALEQAIAFVTDLRRLADTAPDGTVLDACEALAVGDGRQLLRDSLAAAVPARADAADSKKAGGRPKGRRTRNLPTVVGPVRLTRADRTAPGGDGAGEADGFSGWTAASPARPSGWPRSRPPATRSPAPALRRRNWPGGRSTASPSADSPAAPPAAGPPPARIATTPPGSPAPAG